MSADKNKQSRGAQFKEWLSFFNQSAIPLPMIVFGVLAIAVLTVSTLYQQNLQHTMRESVARLSRESQVKTVSRLESFVQLARSGSGLIQTEQVDDETWNLQFEAMEIEEKYPSIQGIGYAAARDQTRLEESRLELRHIYPSDARADIFIDMAFDDESTIPATISLAAASGMASLSEAHTQTDDDDAYMCVIVPVYESGGVPDTESARQRNFKGAIFVVSDASTFFSQVYKNHDPAMTGLKVSQKIDGQKTALFSRGNHATERGTIPASQTLNTMGQTFYFDYTFSRAGLVSVSQRYVAVAMPFFGLILSLLLAMVISFTLRARNQRQSIAREREVQAAKDELLSLASHQLRTPATGVKQYLGMVLQGFAGTISETQRDFLDRAYVSNERQLHIINDILYLAKLDAGRIVLTKTKFDLSELTQSIVTDLQETAREADIAIACSIPKKAAIIGDAHMIRMVIENLITNAIKYTDPGGRVTVKLVRTGDNYLIKVADTGVGIAAQDIPKLFQQFVRIPNERISQVSGTGVGLYLARSLTRLHGGDIKVRSKLGEGSVFTITIPRGL